MKQVNSSTELTRSRAIWNLTTAMLSGRRDFPEVASRIKRRVVGQKLIDLRDYYFPRKIFDFIGDKFVDKEAGIPRSDLPRKVTRFIASAAKRFESEYRSSLGLARRVEEIPVPSGEGNHATFLREITNYESGTMGKFYDAALAVESLAFDLRNLLLDEFHDGRVRMLLTGEEQKDSVKIPGFPCSGLTSFVRSYPIRKDMGAIKENYLRKKGEEFLEGIHLPLALRLYALNLERGGQGILESENRALQILKRVEFEDFVRGGGFSGYVERFRGGEDLFSRVSGGLMRLPSGDEEARIEYLALFRNPSNRESEALVRQTAEGFTTLWGNAFGKGWGFELLGSLDHLDYVLDDGGATDVLASQQNGALVELLKDVDFGRNFISAASAEIDYGLLAKLKLLNPGLFKKIYPTMEGDDNQFLSNFVDLVSHTDYDFLGATIGKPLKGFLGNVEDYVEEERDSLGFILNNFGYAQRALQHGLTPFSGEISDLEDRIGFSNWIFENQEVLDDVDHYENVEPYLAGSKSELLRGSLIGLSRRHGGKSARVCLEKFKGLDAHPLIRVAGLLGESENPKKLCRKREYVFSLEHLALTLSDHEWGRFVGEALENKNGGAGYESLFEARGGLLSERSGRLGSAKVKKSGLLRSLYHQFRGTDREALVDRLMTLRETTLSRKATEGVCRWLDRGQFRLAEQVIEGVEDEAYGSKNVEDIVSNYGTDADLSSIPLSEYIAGGELKWQVVSTMASAPVVTWDCSFTPSAQRDFDSLQGSPIKDKLAAQIEHIKKDPRVGKRLRSHLGGYRSVRAGHLRAIYEIKPTGKNEGSVLIHRVNHRQRAYGEKI
ncbi:type II toxin-antitoxin system RelE/ParE family toxin [archaeon]|nr:type II toxin-antitoxin system RelE/ParE family toxin [archaeon]